MKNTCIDEVPFFITHKRVFTACLWHPYTHDRYYNAETCDIRYVTNPSTITESFKKYNVWIPYEWQLFELLEHYDYRAGSYECDDCGGYVFQFFTKDTELTAKGATLLLAVANAVLDLYTQ
jgi:hypothetical protein